MEEIPDIAATDLPNPVCSGFLNKKRPSKKLLSVKYQKRWCVIHEGIFYYYDGQLDRKQKGAFDLTGYKFFHLVGAENSFAFVKKGNRSFEFIASSRKDFAKWEEAMRVVNREDSKQSATSERHENYTKEKRKPRLPKGRAIPEIPEERPPAKVVNLPKRPPPPVPTSSVEEEDEDEFYMDPNEINDGGTPTLHHGANRRPPHKAVSTKDSDGYEKVPDRLPNDVINKKPTVVNPTRQPNEVINKMPVVVDSPRLPNDVMNKIPAVIDPIRLPNEVINKTPAVVDPLFDPFYSIAERIPLPPERSDSESDDYEEVLDDDLDDNSQNDTNDYVEVIDDKLDDSTKKGTDVKQDDFPIYSVVQRKTPSGSTPPPRPPNLRTQRSQGSTHTSSEADDDQEIDYLDVTEINSNPKKIISNSKSTPNPTIAHLLASASTRKKQKSVDNSDQEIDNGYAEFIADVKTKPDQSDDVGSDESDIYLDYGDDVDDMEDTHDSDSGRQMYAKPLKRNISADSVGQNSDSESSGDEPSDMYEDVDDVDVSSVVDDFNKTHSKPKREIPRPVISEDEDSFDNNDSRVSPPNGNSKSKEVPQMLNPLMQEMKQKMNIKEKPSRKPVQKKNSKEETFNNSNMSDPVYENISEKDKQDIIRKNSDPSSLKSTKQSPSRVVPVEDTGDSGSEEELYENF